jgi:hypothetical protein
VNGQTATVTSDHTFSFTVQLSDTASGQVTAQITDAWGQQSDVAEDSI